MRATDSRGSSQFAIAPQAQKKQNKVIYDVRAFVVEGSVSETISVESNTHGLMMGCVGGGCIVSGAGLSIVGTSGERSQEVLQQVRVTLVAEAEGSTPLIPKLKDNVNRL
jgi:hypothetical protein